ncbi:MULTISPECIES: adenine phosphoribosyltransferase [unclassified Halanaerobium]|uniref:adenine phosphoribosyltransferase n=1 Tax=unclassified Halanaerobium TaxID=2641197 RepID=UPI000DF3D3D7|nr:MULTISPECIES: adenine phosphoribosyltransferase [unclassified Halanaerobium]RCW43788.1 adenine phosphoribosyltransferase [Halanaerobium sp. MA284_MarDTE_T2]RCW80212.1 adenine phosphoribosyltransferase [Halanaerobium sp. DL-01]
MNLKEKIRNIPDFPEKGILFKDITPLLKDKNAFKEAIVKMADMFNNKEFDYVVGIEARGFIVGTPLALEMDKGFIPIRRPGKLPYDTLSISYELEYGKNKLEIHKDAIDKGDKILLIDDLLATGGTTKAAVELIEKLGGQVIGCGFLLELGNLEGRKMLEGYDIRSLLID